MRSGRARIWLWLRRLVRLQPRQPHSQSHEEVAQDTAQVFLVVDNEDALAHEPLALDAKLNRRLVPRSRSILFTEVANVEGCGRPMQAL